MLQLLIILLGIGISGALKHNVTICELSICPSRVSVRQLVEFNDEVMVKVKTSSGNESPELSLSYGKSSAVLSETNGELQRVGQRENGSTAFVIKSSAITKILANRTNDGNLTLRFSPNRESSSEFCEGEIELIKQPVIYISNNDWLSESTRYCVKNTVNKNVSLTFELLGHGLNLPSPNFDSVSTLEELHVRMANKLISSIDQFGTEYRLLHEMVNKSVNLKLTASGWYRTFKILGDNMHLSYSVESKSMCAFLAERMEQFFPNQYMNGLYDGRTTLNFTVTLPSAWGNRTAYSVVEFISKGLFYISPRESKPDQTEISEANSDEFPTWVLIMIAAVVLITSATVIIWLLYARRTKKLHRTQLYIQPKFASDKRNRDLICAESQALFEVDRHLMNSSIFFSEVDIVLHESEWYPQNLDITAGRETFFNDQNASMSCRNQNFEAERN